MTSIFKALAAATVLATVVLAAQVGTAAGATPCWKKLLNDWYDGRIDNVYPVSCYRQTLQHLPEDISVYSSARDDILRALQSARAQLRKNKKPAGPTALVPAQTTTEPSPTTTNEQSSTTTTAGAPPGGTDAGGGTSSPGRKPPPGLAQQLNSSSPSSVPVPLLVLGGLAILLVAAGAVGLVVKRTQGRRPGH